MTTDEVIARIDVAIDRVWWDKADQARLDLASAGVACDDAEAIVTIGRELFDAARPALLTSVRQAVHDAGPIGALTIRTV